MRRVHPMVNMSPNMREDAKFPIQSRFSHPLLFIYVKAQLLFSELLGDGSVAAVAAEWLSGLVAGEAVVDGLGARGGKDFGKRLAE